MQSLDPIERIVIVSNNSSISPSPPTGEIDQEILLEKSKICIDDTIQMIKKKILRELFEKGIETAYEEMHLFIRTIRQTNDLTTESSYDALGKRFLKHDEPDYHANPFTVDPETLFVERRENPLLSLENLLLLSHPPSLDNTIYVCFPTQVLDFLVEKLPEGSDPEEKERVESIVFKTYFPLLYAKFEDTDQRTLWETRRKEWIEETRQRILSTDFLETVDFFYNMDQLKKTRVPLSMGISSIHLLVSPQEKTNIPLDPLFKYIHSTPTVPLIKYNPGKRRENIYRLYAEDVTKHGEKIPVLKGNLILRLAKEFGRKQHQISFFLETRDGSARLYMTLQPSGELQMRAEWKSPVGLKEAEENIYELSEQMILSIRQFMEKTGSTFPQEFRGFYSDSCKLLQMNCRWSTNLSTTFDVNMFERCLMPMFVFPRTAEQSMRFKRVENYREMDEQTIFISDVWRSTENIKEVLDEFVAKYPEYSEEKAAALIAKVLAELGANTSMNAKWDNPGFPVRMNVDALRDNLFTVEVEIQDHFSYMQVLEMYIEGLLRITQTKDVAKKEINKYCSGEYKRELRKLDTIRKKQQQLDIFDYGNVEATEHISLRISEEDENEEIVFELSDASSSSSSEEENSPFKFNEDSESEEEEKKRFRFFEDDDEDDDDDEEKEKDEENIFSEEFPTDDSSFQMFTKGGDGSSEQESANDANEDADNDLSLRMKQLDGKPLYEKNNNYFLTRLKNRDPTLFLTKDETTAKGRFKAYSTHCQANQSRQPIILTDAEKEEIDKKHKGSYKSALKYRGNWYVCPRYWCLLSNTSMTEQDLLQGKCGGIDPKTGKVKPIKDQIIPAGNKTIPVGKYVYEFNHSDQHHTSKNAEYIWNTPGFLSKEKEKHPDGLCLPCCFKKEFNSDPQIKARARCQAQEKIGEHEAQVNPAEKRKLQTQTQTYIVSNTNFPADAGRWGYLPFSVQNLLQTDNAASMDPNNNANLKPNSKTMLRLGVEASTTKSFVACLASLYSHYKKQVKPHTIAEMCDVIASAVSLDLFVRVQNGSLSTIFQKKYRDEMVDLAKYAQTEFVQSFYTGNEKVSETRSEFMQETIAAYENFIDFLKSPDSIIDYQYLWDIVCLPNPLLFASGMNLAILRILDNDVRDNIEVLCPTSAYSSMIYDKKKETFILIQQDVFFEPVYLYENKPVRPIIEYTFFETLAAKNIQYILKVIRNASSKYCSPMRSMQPKVYTFTQNISAQELAFRCLRLQEQGISILSQVLNFQGKTVAVIVSVVMQPETGETSIVYLPCRPSGALNPTEYPVKYMDDVDLWSDYDTTVDTLQHVSSLASPDKERILCKPTHRVVEDEQVVGILTETNQMVLVDPPINVDEVDNDHDLPIIRETNYLLADRELAKKLPDTERVQSVRKIRMETMFYNQFRILFRSLIHRPEYSQEKTEITRLMETSASNPSNSLVTLQQVLKSMMRTATEFRVYDEKALDVLEKCMEDSDKKCIAKTPAGKYIFPKQNLISGKENMRIYYVKLADELLRNRRIRAFLLDAKVHMNMESEYRINETELILLQSMITPKYFEDLVPFAKLKNVRIPYDLANPQPTKHAKKYSNRLTLEEQSKFAKEKATKEENLLEIECVEQKREIVGNSTNVWKKRFLASRQAQTTQVLELEFYQKKNCTFYPLLWIFKQVYRTDITIEAVREKLWTEIHNRQFHLIREGNKDKNPPNKYLHLLKQQGKGSMAKSVLEKKQTFEQMIRSDAYYLSNIDYWVLATSMKLPIILFSTKPSIKHLIDVSWLRLGENENLGVYYFIRAPTENDDIRNVIYSYNMISHPFALDDLGDFRSVYEKKLEDPDSMHFVGVDDFMNMKK